jgi:hypothetical protein
MRTISLAFLSALAAITPASSAQQKRPVAPFDIAQEISRVSIQDVRRCMNEASKKGVGVSRNGKMACVKEQKDLMLRFKGPSIDIPAKCSVTVLPIKPDWPTLTFLVDKEGKTILGLNSPASGSQRYVYSSSSHILKVVEAMSLGCR